MNELNLDLAPEAGLATTAEMIGEVQAAVPVTAPAADIDSTGTAFDPEIHKVDSSGCPMLGSKKQFLLKKEAKKSAGQKIKEGFSRLWNGEKDGKEELPESPELPLSDHEFDKIQAEKQENGIEAGERMPVKRGEVTPSAENSADMYFVGLSMFLGIEALNQRDRFFGHVSQCFYEYEKRTGRCIDLPPGAALAVGLGRVGWEIVQKEPECKKRFDAGAKVVRENAVKYIGRKLPKFRKEQPQEDTGGGGLS